MDTRLLHTFTTLARTGSFTAAAAELHLAQSTVTVHIRTLERELDARLFDRLPTGALLTDTGRRLLERAEDVLDAVARLRVDGAGNAAVGGRVVVGTPESLCTTRLPGVVAALRTSHPEVDVQLYAGGTAQCVEGLRSGRLDVALLLEEETDFPDVTSEAVAREPLALVCSPGHPLAARADAPAWAELAAESVFLLERGCSYSDALERRLLAVPGARPRLTRFGSVDAARSCVTAGLGVTLLPLTTVRDHLREGRLVRLDGPPFADVPVRLARHRRRWTSPATQTFVGELVRQLPGFLATPDDQPLAPPERLANLTEREREVMTLAAHGKSDTEIAGALFVSPLTVRSHIQHAMTKLDARDRTQLVVVAYQNGLVAPRPAPGS